ncbi:hypothetical protein D9757_008523 [Collybiopsis confluens]|uniref:Multiple myeloma tumor-associated protein 2-like N-terminal domain-containing protein n=1 Tax=Collybiopsis confluens TaxID=2823264 RepID=A0A8H5LZZ7_9AGAR|nr:hypothetical protein D9757_008523 [Collybiopsis confluens]
MFEPIRGGTRGGQAEFKWSDVSADKDRENYLGHSINAPTGRWQKNKDVHWYSRDLQDSEDKRREEIRKVKEAEADALAAALGFDVAPKTAASESKKEPDDTQRLIEKEERRQRKEARRARKEAKKEAKETRHRERRRRDSRSRSPYPSRPARSRTPPRRDRDSMDYDERDRRRWREY